MWPILGYFSNLAYKTPNVFVIGTFYGKLKPDNFNEYLQDFVDELCNLINNGIEFNNKQIKVLLKGIICDVPAKAFILNIHGHNGKKSCVKCEPLGKFENHSLFSRFKFTIENT